MRFVQKSGNSFNPAFKVFELGVRTAGGLFLGVWYAGGIDFRRFHTPSLRAFGVILGLLEASKTYKLF